MSPEKQSFQRDLSASQHHQQPAALEMIKQQQARKSRARGGQTSLKWRTNLGAMSLVVLAGFWWQGLGWASGQEIFRRNPLPQPHLQHQNQPTPVNNQQQNNLNSLANLQLPPQLANLTPQQLHQLAQLREMQLQQQAAQQQQQQQQASPTAQPAASASAQIPQPGGAPTSAVTAPADDDGSYNEAGTEMEGVSQPASNSGGGQAGVTPTSGASTAAPATPTFEVNWNKCPQLEPSDSDKSKKTQVITTCLQSAPIPSNLTHENVEAHREQIATCALKVEGWFDERNQYKYDKAESEIRAKRLDSVIENQVLKFHVACKDEASKKFSKPQDRLIDQVQFYQACMDYYISIVCEIEVSVEQ